MLAFMQQDASLRLYIYTAVACAPLRGCGTGAAWVPPIQAEDVQQSCCPFVLHIYCYESYALPIVSKHKSNEYKTKGSKDSIEVYI